MKMNFSIGLALISWCFASHGVGQTFRNGGETQLIEVFTSEGCSSCPPADRWLYKQGKKPGLFTSFVGIGYHVDYWNDLGWRDPFSHQSFSRRQHLYYKRKRLQSVATPTVLVDGKPFRGWRQDKPIPTTKRSPVVLEARKLKTHHLEVRFQPKTLGQTKRFATACLIGRTLKSKITRGENQGKTLKHDLIGLGCETSQLNQSKTAFTGRLPLTNLNRIRAPSYAFVVWISQSPKGTPLYVLSGDLGKGK